MAPLVAHSPLHHLCREGNNPTDLSLPCLLFLSPLKLFHLMVTFLEGGKGRSLSFKFCPRTPKISMLLCKCLDMNNTTMVMYLFVHIPVGLSAPYLALIIAIVCKANGVLPGCMVKHQDLLQKCYNHSTLFDRVK